MDGCTDPKVCVRLAAVSNEALGMLNSFVLRTANEYVNNRKWDGKTATTMQAHIEQCR